ncbi:MAG: SDR family NAD(P)-dependent oxidoreductase [Chloroflexi bacterium]|nr:MAG: SDR family NAD(P)-dependent oxidoreductase [Chloroflexota bacterium]
MNGKTVMVTGATGNVGMGVVQAFAAAGANVALVDLDADKIARVINSDLGGDTSRFKGFPANLGEANAVQTVVQDIATHFGKIDALVHTVGGYAAGDPVHAGNLAVFDKMINLNARMMYLVCGAVARYMVEAGVRGSISIVLARAAQKGTQNHAAYSASKAAAMRIMESMAAELKTHGIRVNGVSPSIVDTPPNREAMPNANFDNWVKPEQIGNLMVFLATNEAMTGANVEISAWS